MLDTAKTKTKSALHRTVASGTEEIRYLTRMSAGFSKAAVARGARRFDGRDTRTWEFSAFSQNGEDGIVEELLSFVHDPNCYFVEIGASDGLENNVSYLAYVKKYAGVMVEGDQRLSDRARRNLQTHNWAVEFVSMMVEPATASALKRHCLEVAPDFLSLDIDGNDYHVMKALLETGLRPKVLCLEYNSAFGPDDAVTIPYQPGFVYQTAHRSQLYYGASVAAWRHLLGQHGYTFVTVEANGVNAFFVDAAATSVPMEHLRRVEFAENVVQRRRFRGGWEVQRAEIGDMRLLSANEA